MNIDQIDALFERLNEPLRAGGRIDVISWRAKREGFRQAMGMLEVSGWIDGDGDMYFPWGQEPPKGWTNEGTPYPLYRIREDRNG